MKLKMRYLFIIIFSGVFFQTTLIAESNNSEELSTKKLTSKDKNLQTIEEDFKKFRVTIDKKEDYLRLSIPFEEIFITKNE